MSRTLKPTRAPVARQARLLTNQFTAQLTGRKRGTDREVRRDSYDVEDSRAKVHAKVGDGSAAQGLAHRDALVQAADELRRHQWKETPLPQVREARVQHAAHAAELQLLMESGAAPIGRPATLRQEIERLDGILERDRNRIRRIDVTVLVALLRHLDFKTGRLFPALETIANAAGCHKNSAIAALKRLKHHGFIAWVRRSIRTGADGQFAPQREQTSNAYYFDHRKRMAQRTWSRFWQLLVAKMRRFGTTPAGAGENTAAPAIASPALQAALDSVGALVASAST